MLRQRCGLLGFGFAFGINQHHFQRFGFVLRALRRREGNQADHQHMDEQRHTQRKMKAVIIAAMRGTPVEVGKHRFQLTNACVQLGQRTFARSLMRALGAARERDDLG